MGDFVSSRWFLMVCAVPPLVAACQPSVEIAVLGAEEASAVRVAIAIHSVGESATGCEDARSGEVAPLFEGSVSAHEPLSELPHLVPGSYAIVASATDASCYEVARGCVVITLPASASISVVLERHPAPTLPRECSVLSECVSGACVARDARDRCGAVSSVIAGNPRGGLLAMVLGELHGHGPNVRGQIAPDASEYLGPHLMPLGDRPDGPIATGSRHSCVVASAGVYCSGREARPAAISPGPEFESATLGGVRWVSSAVEPRGVDSWDQLALGERFTCGIESRRGLDADGTTLTTTRHVACFGDEITGVPEDPSSTDVVTIVANERELCSMTATGTIRCGPPHNLPTAEPTGPPGPLAPGEEVAWGAALLALGPTAPDGSADLCVVDASGLLLCGRHASGPIALEPVLDGSGHTIDHPIRVALGAEGGCAVVGGGVRCWGRRALALDPLERDPFVDVVVTADAVIARALSGALHPLDGRGCLLAQPTRER